MSETENRRPLKTRSAGWAQGLAAGIARAGVAPDMVSASSMVFALAGFALFWISAGTEGGQRALLLVLAGVMVQLRLMANLMDGLVAVEHGRGGPHGPIWNELPDRVADALFLIGAGYALRLYDPVFGPLLGWFAAVLAVLTAYVRELGRGLGQPADFAGPGAKPHRMFVLTVGCAATAILSLLDSDWTWAALWLALATIVALTAITVVRRTVRLARSLSRAA